MGEGNEQLMLCPYCDGTPTINLRFDSKPYISCEKCEFDFGYNTEDFDGLNLAQKWNEWVKLEMEERYGQARP